MPGELCNGCLKNSRAHRFNPNTMFAVWGVCRKEVTLAKDEFDGRYLPVRHFIKKRDQRARRVKGHPGSRGGMGTRRLGRR